MTNTLANTTAATPTTESWGYVTVRPGQLRPAYRRTDDTIAYTPSSTEGWRDAPAELAATYLHRYAEGDWQPAVIPDGYRIAS